MYDSVYKRLILVGIIQSVQVLAWESSNGKKSSKTHSLFRIT